MFYLKAFFFNAFIVFFANYITPGIDVASITKIPTLGSDVVFALALGLLNTLIYPILKLFRQATAVKIAGLALVVNLVAYAILKLFPVIGIHVTSLVGYFAAAISVAVVSFLTGFLEMRHAAKNQPQESPPEFQQMPPNQ